MRNRLAYWRDRDVKRRQDPAYKAKKAASDKAIYERRKSDPDFKARRAARQHQYRNDPELRFRHEARWAVQHALASGKLIKMPCEVCGAVRVDGHHDDYERPLDVRWLCRKHHNEHHARATSPESLAR